jgi:hypothetical protein
MRYADGTKNNAVARILNLGITMAVAAEPVRVGADGFGGLLEAAAVGVGVTAAKATVDVFVGQYDAYDEALRAKSHQKSELSAFNTVLSTSGTGSKGGSGRIVIGGGINNGGKDSGGIGGIKGVDGSACGGGHPVTAFAHAAASEFH